MDVVQKLWGFCNTLRHDGINYGDYIEQLTYLLFLKLADERGLAIPAGLDWAALRELSGTELRDHYEHTLRELGKQPNLLGAIFAGALSRFREPTNLKRLIQLIDEIEWAALDVDLKAEAYEGLLQKFAAEQKGAGQYFTPRPLIRTMVQCTQPDIRAHEAFTIHDPAAGTGGFLIGAVEWLLEATNYQLERDVQRRMVHGTYSGAELVQETRRLALMNLFLHGIEGDIRLDDSLAADPGARYDVILTNPPFGTQGATGVPNRDDFTVSTSNKQLNFIQHTLTILKPGGRAALVLPDNVLFEDHAGRDVRRILMHDCNLHTILRLPVGTFTPYSPGVKANVLFFHKVYDQQTSTTAERPDATPEVWVYDLRTNVPKVTKRQPLTPEVFADFRVCYGPDPAPRRGQRQETERFRRFARDEIAARGDNLDIFWLKDESLDDPAALPEPEDILGEALTQLQTAMSALDELAALLNNGGQEQAQ